ncbi:hypothetical protein [Nitrospira moscoviensis]|uniref:hypothetical protein n=1 Tax=Nitrospira moscoviensis TaxID=42253 RepID=UPI0006A7D499|nr:hypothetical protein [Nitrospira moscoviensis]
MALMEVRAEAGQLPLAGVGNLSRRCSSRPDTAKEKAGDQTPCHARVSWNPHDRLTVFYGHPLAARFASQAVADRAMAGESVVYLDGAHTFDPFFIGRLARGRRQQPRKVLAMIHVARAFTALQMERLLSNCLAGALERYEARIAVLSGLVETLSDETLSERDVARLSDRMLESIGHLTQQGVSLLCPCPAAPRSAAPAHRLFAGLCSTADRCIRFHDVQGEVMVEESLPRLEGTASSLPPTDEPARVVVSSKLSAQCPA